MKTKNEHKISAISIAVLGCFIIAVILIFGTLGLGRIADKDTKEAIRNVSLLYLSELAGRREQVVSSILDDYIRDLDVAVGMLSEKDLSSTKNLQDYQIRMKQLYDLDKFAFIDTTGVIYTSMGTRNDIDQYAIDYQNLTEPEISIKNLHSSDKKVVVAVPVDNLSFGDKTLIVCFMEIDMDNLLRNVSVQSNNNTTFCNLYTSEGVALTDMVLGGLASEDNLLEALGHAEYEKGYSYEGVQKDFAENRSGEVSFSYDGISETLYYVPVRGTDWMLTYLIRESIIGEQINSISDSIIVRSVLQSILTALVLILMFVILFMQQRKATREALDREVSETENRVRQQELEEQLAMQEELASKSEELSEALQAAEDANRAKSGFVSNMSHEIRTPITAILGMNEMIRRECNDENILSYADNISSAGESLLGIISDILDFSKIEAGRMELSLEDYDPQAMIQDLYNLVCFRTEAKGLNLIFRIDRRIPKGLVGDELRLKQVITNLLTNAVKYTEKGDVCLDIRAEERDVKGNRVKLLIQVTDTGIGIRAEEMEKLFVPFDRLDVTRNRSIEGAGLGLSITRQLLQMMGSELLVESVYEKGSRFYFSVWQDICDAEEMGEFKPSSTANVSRDDGKARRFFTAPGKKILVVDDMPMNLQVLTGLLKRSQMTVRTAPGGEECIRMFGEEDFDLVFLDFRMPGMDGIETLHRLKELYPEKTARIPIIALTASAILGDKERLLKEGFTEYLAKPVIIADMEDLMARYLGGVQSESKEEQAVEASGEIPGEILGIQGLDHETGLAYCGDEEDYLFALETYAESVEEKAAALEASLAEDRIEDYVLIVHSLKSMSKSIGASSLSEQAKALELAGREGDKDRILADTGAFLKAYRALGAEVKKGLSL
ncbi:MAG: response regulator [Lachnospiraceae bacterium]|nr:response regulator [Lachnospiraceae bacterium]